MKVRWKYKMFGLLVVAGILLGGMKPANAQTTNPLGALPAYVPGELLVRLQPGITPTLVNGHIAVGAASLDTLLQQYGVTAAEPLFADIGANAEGLERIYKLHLSAQADLLLFLAALSANSYVEYAEPNYIYHTEEIANPPDEPDTAAASPTTMNAATGRLPNDPLFPYQWALHNPNQTGPADIPANDAWTLTTGITNVLIAVIDSGIDYTHEDLNDGRVRTDIDKDYVNKDDDAMDDNGHGTHVAGTIAAESDNGIGVTGILWQAQLLPLKVCDKQGSCTTDDIATAIRYAADQGARIITMSLGGSCASTLESAIDYAYFEKGVIIMAAAGNSNGALEYPGGYDPVIGVGAIDRHGQRAYFSNYGDALDLVAPGVRVFSTVPNNGYDTFSGTSMATPHVTGVAGLLLAQRPNLTNHQVRAILEQSADDLGETGFDRIYGYGLVDAYRALQTATPVDAPVPAQAKCADASSDCGATASLKGQPDEDALLTNLRAVRDQIFTQQPGARWKTIYYAHQFEVFWLIMADAQLRAEALAAIRTLSPALETLLDIHKADTVITTEMVKQTGQVVSSLAARGSASLHDDLTREWQAMNPTRFVGSPARSAWQVLTLEAQPSKVYLPLVSLR